MRTGHLDTLAAYTGLEFAGWILLPGKWLKAEIEDLWNHYLYLVDLRHENDEIEQRLESMASALAKYKEESAEVRRLRQMLSFSPPEPWTILGARVVAQRLGPHAALETIIVDRGLSDDVVMDTPAVTHEGVVGRVVRTGPLFSNLLLVSDLNSRVAVLGQKSRTSAILSGMGVAPLQALYVPLNAPLEEGELFITSGLDGIFPKGLPVAKITQIERSEISLFLTVRARMLVDTKNLEEVLLLQRTKRGLAGSVLLRTQ